MTIEKALLKAILNFDSIYIPDIGTLKISYDENFSKKNLENNNAKIVLDTKEHTKDINLNKSLLSFNFKPEEISEIISQFVNKLKSLEENEKYYIEDIGYFTKKDNTITFIQNTKINIKKDFIFFEEIKLPEASKITEEVKEDKKIETKQQLFSNIKESKSEPITSTKNLKTQKTKFSAKKILLPLLILLSLLSLVFVGYILSKNKIFNKEKILTAQQIKNEKIQATPQINKDSLFTKKIYLGDNFNKFYLICGSYLNKNNALNHLNELKKQGYNASILEGSKYYRISIGSYNDYESAKKDYYYYKTKLGDVWILINSQ